MTSINTQASERYRLVSSLYGLGAITAWYLTILAVLISWTINRKKCRSRSLDVDFITIVTLPSVAVGHLLWQVSEIVHNAHNPGDVHQLAQRVAALEASLSVIETFMPISVIFFLLATWRASLLRAIVIGLVGLSCLATECYMHFTGMKKLRIGHSVGASDDTPSFTRPFVADFFGSILAILVLLFVSSLIVVALALHFLSSRRSLDNEALELDRQIEGRNPRQDVVDSGGSAARSSAAQASPPEANSTHTREMRQRAELFARMDLDRTQLSLITLLSYPLMFMAVAVSMGPGFLQITGSEAWTVWRHVCVFASRQFPHSGSTFSDLDQAVVAAAGASVLAFSMYDAARAMLDNRPPEG